MSEQLQQVRKMFENTFLELVGIELKTFEEGNVLIEVKIRDGLLNAAQQLHGGVYATMLDAIMGLVIRSATGRHPVTIQMDVRFFAPVAEGTLTAVGEIVHRGRKMITAEGKIFHGEQLVAKSTGTFKTL